MDEPTIGPVPDALRYRDGDYLPERIRRRTAGRPTLRQWFLTGQAVFSRWVVRWRVRVAETGSISGMDHWADRARLGSRPEATWR